MHSLTAAKNAKNTVNTSLDSSPDLGLNITNSSSIMTGLFENESHCGELSYSQTLQSSETCVSSFLMSKAQIQRGKRKWGQIDNQQNGQQTLACAGTRVHAHQVTSAASTVTSAPIAAALITSMETVLINPKQAQIEDNHTKLPRHVRTFHWDSDISGISHLATISESLPPLLDIPDDKLMNDVVTNPINKK